MKTATRTVTRGIFNRVPTGNYVGNVEQFRTVKIGEQTTVYNYVAEENALIINGAKYKVVEDFEFTIKIQKSQIKAVGGASGLLDFLTRETLDSWELKIIERCRPMKI